MTSNETSIPRPPSDAVALTDKTRPAPCVGLFGWRKGAAAMAAGPDTAKPARAYPAA